MTDDTVRTYPLLEILLAQDINSVTHTFGLQSLGPKGSYEPLQE